MGRGTFHKDHRRHFKEEGPDPLDPLWIKGGPDPLNPPLDPRLEILQCEMESNVNVQPIEQ